MVKNRIILRRDDIAALHKVNLATASRTLKYIREDLGLKPTAQVTIWHYCKFMNITIEDYYEMQRAQDR